MRFGKYILLNFDEFQQTMSEFSNLKNDKVGATPPAPSLNDDDVNVDDHKKPLLSEETEATASPLVALTPPTVAPLTSTNAIKKKGRRMVKRKQPANPGVFDDILKMFSSKRKNYK